MCVVVRRKRLLLASGEVIENSPKSEAGRRRVALPKPLVQELERHLANYGSVGAESYVFTSANGKPLERGNFRSRVWIPATRAVGLTGLRFHDLRHAAGTLAARTGATTKELMARLGHAGPQAAMIYQHATEYRDRLIAERLATMTTDVGSQLSRRYRIVSRRAPMPEPLQLRTAAPPETIVVIRLGERTLEDSKLVDQSRGRTVDGAYTASRSSRCPTATIDCSLGWCRLSRCARFFEARGAALVSVGFPLFPTADHPHWTVVLSEPTPAQFGRVRALFDGPKQNPAWSGRTVS